MFERYSEVARRAIFFARYEASQRGSPYIETHHLLLGLMRESKDFFTQQLGPPAVFDEIRKQFEAAFPARDPGPTSVDLPLSADSKRVLAIALSEADTLGHSTITTVHLVLGLMQIENNLAAQVLRERGMTVERLRAEAGVFAGKAAVAHVPLSLGRREIDPRRVALHRLVGGLPDDRVHAATQVLEALSKETVDITVRTPQGKFTMSFEPPGAAAEEGQS